MPLPSMKDFREPLLEYLKAQPGPVPNHDVHKALADHFHLTEEEQAIVDNGVPKYKNLIAWAYVYLQGKGLCDPMTKAQEYQLSSSGKRDERVISSERPR